MRKGVFFAVLTVISGCGAPVMHDVVVARRTLVVSEQPRVVAPEMALPDIVFLGTSPKDGFAFFDRTTSNTLVVRLGEGTSFTLAGHVLAEQWLGTLPEMEAGFRARDGQFRPRTLTESLVLVQDDTSVFVADLDAGGIARARFPKDTLGVHREPSVGLTAWTTSRLIVAPEGSERFELPATMSSGSASLAYHDRLLSIREDDGFHLVDLDTKKERPLPANTKNIQFEKTGYFAISDTTIELWNATDTKPRIRVQAAEPYGLYLGNGKIGFSQASTSGTSLEIVEIATGKRTHIAAQAASCGGETIIAIEKGHVRTDATCDPGCASLGEIITPHVVTYDLFTGAVVAEQQQARGPDGGRNGYYDQFEAAREQAVRLGLPPESLVRHGDGDAFLHWDGKSLRELDPSGAHRAELIGPNKAPSHFGYVGENVVATVGPSAFIWDRKGGLVWANDPHPR